MLSVTTPPSQISCTFTLFLAFLALLALNVGCRSYPTDTDGSQGENQASVSVDTSAGRLRVETLASGLDTPWDLTWGPDDTIWVTERKGVISRVETTTGRVTRVGKVGVIEVSESGLMGLAFHPDFSAQPYVYVIHSFGYRGSIRNRLVRMRFYGDSLGSPKILLDNIPGARNHNGSRLAVGPDRYLYITTGDAQNSSLAQKRSSLAGKVLRLTLDGHPAPGNPFDNAVYSFGHRNAQGIVFHPGTGALYITEHGPADNDEVNLIKKGGNYGWPMVRGFCDGWADKFFCWKNNVIEPLFAWTPTIAPSGIDFYNAELIPGWKGNLLFTTLRGSALYRLVFSPDGNRIIKQEVYFQGQFGRLRDVLVGPQGEVYLATSNRDGRGTPAANDDRILRIQP